MSMVVGWLDDVGKGRERTSERQFEMNGTLRRYGIARDARLCSILTGRDQGAGWHDDGRDWRGVMGAMVRAEGGADAGMRGRRDARARDARAPA